MKIGVNLVNFGPAIDVGVLEQWVDVVQSLGFHQIMTSDHIAITPDVAVRFPAPFYEPLTTLGWLAHATKEISIGASVIVLPYRSPLETARAFAGLDQLSGGRCILGVGVGWAREEYAALGVPFTERGRIADEYLNVIRKHWTEDISSFTGQFLSYENVSTGPKPLQRPHPPIWIGGASNAAMQRAVRYGDAWHPFKITTAGLKTKGLPLLESFAKREKKPTPDICPRIYLRFTDTDLPENERVAGEGTIAQVHHDLAQLHEMGCKTVMLDTYTEDGEAARNPAIAWNRLRTFSEKIYDLSRQNIR